MEFIEEPMEIKERSGKLVENEVQAIVVCERSL